MYAPFRKPEPETRTFTPDLAGLIAWLELQNPATEYCFVDTGNCLFGRFHRAIRIAVVPNFRPDAFHPHALNDLYPRAAEIAAPTPHTYASALLRARALAKV